MSTKSEIAVMEVALEALRAKLVKETEAGYVSFSSRTELAKALMDGRTFKTKSDGGDTLCYDEEKCAPFRVTFLEGFECSMDTAWDKYGDLWEVVKVGEVVEPWYLNMPAGGVLCRVWDGEVSYGMNVEVTIEHYDKGMSYPFRSSCNSGSWVYANPVKT